MSSVGKASKEKWFPPVSSTSIFKNSGTENPDEVNVLDLSHQLWQWECSLFMRSFSASISMRVILKSLFNVQRLRHTPRYPPTKHLPPLHALGWIEIKPLKNKPEAVQDLYEPTFFCRTTRGGCQGEGKRIFCSGEFEFSGQRNICGGNFRRFSPPARSGRCAMTCLQT